MEARLYELIRAFQRERADALGVSVPGFRLRPLTRFATAHPADFPEYTADPARLARVVEEARAAGEIVLPHEGGRDDEMMLRVDRDHAI